MNELIVSRIRTLRGLMEKNGIDAYLILTDDFHASEYVDDYFKCRAYMSGFTGSAGTLLILKDSAALWTDGRYFLQAGDQLKGTGIELMKSGEPGVPTIFAYLRNTLSEGSCLAFDGRTVSYAYFETLKRVLKAKNIKFNSGVDLVGDIWPDRPAFPAHPVWELSAEYTGETRQTRLERVRAAVKEKKAEAFLMTSLDDIAWLFELRGNDIEFNPVFMSYAIVYPSEAVIYADPAAFAEELKAELAAEKITIRPYLDVYKDLGYIDAENIMADPAGTNMKILQCVKKDTKITLTESPAKLMKAVKTETEMANERIAHIQDGVAVTKLIYWLDQKTKAGEITSETELSVAEKLLSFRKERPGFLDQSFGPIIATGEHGAIVHYGPTEETDWNIRENTFLLMDTGGQYLQGTTDITRTVAIGSLSEEQKIHYTAVLRGNLNLAAAKFRNGITGVNLDALARTPLWEIGLDFNHGTGHGVGYLLNVHEGPQGIRLKDKNGGIGAPMVPGMLTSDEPGVYLTGKYGIRSENLMLCVPYKTTDYGDFYQFETVTMVPFDRNAILPEMMTGEERKLLNDYHKEVYENISPYLTDEECSWLAGATAEI